ncbi:hypothetical protein FB45DRAFT_924085 [Roridomyces roridus]|uniref:Protein CPL1-like domain-containing protein n=1 Tax=Roridomyces roridus TaxID=1738132 RepID=A0AAD7BLW3_9AGAR|nr:hypothetical protein FB45DRAFT_924085 [Roridomyces roridus]
MRFLLTIAALAVIAHGAIIEGLAPRTSRSPETVCACVSGSLVVRGVNCGTIDVKEEICTCVSVLTDFSRSTSCKPIRSGWKIGQSETITALTDKIHGCKPSDKRTCTHPAFSTPNCRRSDLCGYKCDDGYFSYNGECKRSLPSGTAGRGKRSSDTRVVDDYWGREAQKSCKTGWTACGIPGSSSSRAWECIDTSSDLESCGGCTADTISSLTGSTTGVDCTLIPDVADVACIKGKCAVRRCLPGFKVVGTACVEDASLFRVASSGL